MTLLPFKKGQAQDLYIDSGAEFYLKANTNFNSSNTIVTKDPTGKFTVEAENSWGSNSE